MRKEDPEDNGFYMTHLTPNASSSYPQYVSTWKNAMKEAYSLAQRSAVSGAAKGKRSYDSQVRSSILQPDDRVLVRNMRPRGGPGKLRPYWEEKIYKKNNCVKTYWAQWNRLALIDGVLYRRWESDDGQQVRRQLVVPKAMRNDVVTKLHGAKTSGHLGVNKTTTRVKERFYWPNCARDVKDWCKKCELCASRVGPRPAPQAPMKTLNAIGVIALSVLYVAIAHFSHRPLKSLSSHNIKVSTKPMLTVRHMVSKPKDQIQDDKKTESFTKSLAEIAVQCT
ncbi:hypothetical protein QZH41_019238 [Actinostola sp. cb2023]|nr:hypothetical protein QZH41_019238 [Actinostola sp. cb2023]